METLSPVQIQVSQEIQNISTLEASYVKKHWLIVLGAFIIGVPFIVLAALFTEPWYLLGTFFIWGFSWAVINAKARAFFMQQVGAKLGYSYNEGWTTPDRAGSALLSFGVSRDICDILTGTYQELPVRIYDYIVDTSQEKRDPKSRDHGNLYEFSVFEVTYPYQAPHIVLSMVQSAMSIEPSNDPASFRGEKLLTLEGGFDKYFKLRVQEGFETEVLEIFTPDIMAKLIDIKPTLNIEFAENKVYFYKTGTFSTGDQILSAYKTATVISQLVRPKLKEVSGSVSAMSDIVNQVSPAR